MNRAYKVKLEEGKVKQSKNALTLSDLLKSEHWSWFPSNWMVRNKMLNEMAFSFQNSLYAAI